MALQNSKVKQTGATVPQEITSYIMLETKNDSFLPGRQVDLVIRLDEGHDRPFWQWVTLDGRSAVAQHSVWIPQKPETILQDALIMLIADGLQDESLLAIVDGLRNSTTGVVDLNFNPADRDLHAGVSDALAGHIVNLVLLPGSSLAKDADEILKTLGTQFRILS
jgi:hypothetical protein